MRSSYKASFSKKPLRGFSFLRFQTLTLVSTQVAYYCLPKNPFAINIQLVVFPIIVAFLMLFLVWEATPLINFTIVLLFVFLPIKFSKKIASFALFSAHVSKNRKKEPRWNSQYWTENHVIRPNSFHCVGHSFPQQRPIEERRRNRLSFSAQWLGCARASGVTGSESYFWKTKINKNYFSSYNCTIENHFWWIFLKKLTKWYP